MPTSVPLQWKTAESEVDRADPYKQNAYIKSCVSYGYLSLERIKLAAAHDKAKATPFRAVDRGQGRVALETSDERVRIRRQGCKIRAGDASGSSGGTFLSLATNRYLSCPTMDPLLPMPPDRKLIAKADP